MARIIRLPGASSGRRVAADSWGWLVVIGTGCVALGIFALTSTALFGGLTMVVLGTLLVAGGVLLLVGAARAGSVAQMAMDVILAVILMLTGGWLIAQPLEGLQTVINIVASYLFFAGFIRAVFALVDRGAGWGWTMAGGVAGMLLAILIWTGWPISGLDVVGLFIATDLIVGGIAWIATGLSARRAAAAPGPTGQAPATSGG